MAIITHNVGSFAEYVRCITEIGNYRRIAPDKPNVLWSRGHRIKDWNLQPTLLRSVRLNQLGLGSYSFSGRAVEEELRKQNYIAKNYHFFSKDPKSEVEWMEVMQHHGVGTRLLDWSESTLHSLIFALECFFNDKEYRKEDRIQCSPCVWVFEPITWNMIALKEILKNDTLIEQCMNRIFRGCKAKIKKRMNMLETNLENYISMASAPHLKGIFNLADIVGEMKKMDSDTLRNQLLYGELYYCLFYFLEYIYIDTIPKKIEEVLPLSIVESYHSERIRAQKGAFTIFPYYEEDQLFLNAKNMNLCPDAMEYMNKGNSCLHKIMLYNPDKIAFEVMNAGLNVTWLYPEMPVVANAIEQRHIFM